MRPTVDFHNVVSFPAKEIHEVVADWRLPRELQITKLAIAQLCPELGLSRRLVCTQDARSIGTPGLGMSHGVWTML
jgi:hypothetical protein